MYPVGEDVIGGLGAYQISLIRTEAIEEAPAGVYNCALCNAALPKLQHHTSPAF
jgi:hypothetical protein